MLKRSSIVIALALLMLLASSFTTRAADALPTYAATDGVNLFIYKNGQSTQVTKNAATVQFTPFQDLVWSPDGKFLVFTQSVEVPATGGGSDYRLDLFYTDASGAAPVKIVENVASGLPVAFTDASTLLFATDRPENRNATTPDDFRYNLNSYNLLTKAQPKLIRDFPFGVGCGGGSSVPQDGQYSEETSSFGGSKLLLASLPAGTVVSRDCGGGGVQLLAANVSAKPVILTEKQTRVTPSPDGKRLAGVEFTYKEPEPLRALTLLDPATKKTQTIKTAAPPDQLAWGAGDDLYYTSQKLLPTIFTKAELGQLNGAMGMDTNAPGQVPNSQVSIHRINVATGKDDLLYTSDPKPEAGDNSYLLARLQFVGGNLYFTAIPGLSGWARAVLDKKIDLTSSTGYDDSIKEFPVLTYQLDPANKALTSIGSGQRMATFSPAG